VYIIVVVVVVVVVVMFFSFEKFLLSIEREKKRGKEGSDETTRGGAHPRIARAS